MARQSGCRTTPTRAPWHACTHQPCVNGGTTTDLSDAPTAQVLHVLQLLPQPMPEWVPKMCILTGMPPVQDLLHSPDRMPGTAGESITYHLWQEKAACHEVQFGAGCLVAHLTCCQCSGRLSWLVPPPRRAAASSVASQHLCGRARWLAKLVHPALANDLPRRWTPLGVRKCQLQAAAWSRCGSHPAWQDGAASLRCSQTLARTDESQLQKSSQARCRAAQMSLCFGGPEHKIPVQQGGLSPNSIRTKVLLSQFY